MANAAVTTLGGSFVQVTYTGAGLDWSYLFSNSPFPDGMKVYSIEFNPGAANDKLVVNEGGNDGASIIHVECVDENDDKIKYFHPNGRWMKPYIDLSDCTFGAGADATGVKIIFHLA